MIAKLASDMKKPDGLTVFTEKDIPDVLTWVEMDELPGIGNRLKARLFDMGIRNLEQLGKHPLSSLQHEFGPHYGIMISNMGKGIDLTPVPYIDSVPLTKSMGHTHTLAKDTLNRDQVYAVLLRLAEKVGRRLRRHEYQARLVWVWLRWSDFSGRTERQTLKYYIDDGYDLYRIARTMLDRWPWYQPVRAIGVGTSLLIQQGKQLSFDARTKKQEQLVLAQDRINDRYGEQTIARASVLHTSLKRKIGGYKEPYQFV